MTNKNDTTIWRIDNLSSIDGNQITVEGAPIIKDTGNGPAVTFDGIKDGLFFSCNPLEGLASFTVEVLFLPEMDGLAEQRFIHMQEDGPAANRLMIETRVNHDSWYLDTYLQSGTNKLALIKADLTHKTGTWYWAALTYDGSIMRHFVNGIEEASGNINFAPLGKGQASIGVRINKICWFKGAIKELHIHSQALKAQDLHDSF